MANKLQLVSELANQTAHAVTHSVDSWRESCGISARISATAHGSETFCPRFPSTS